MINCILKLINTEQPGWHLAQNRDSVNASWTSEWANSVCGMWWALENCRWAWIWLRFWCLPLARPSLSNPPLENPVAEGTPENYHSQPALSPDFISEKPFGKMKGHCCRKSRGGTWSLAAKGMGKHPSGVGRREPRTTGAGRFPSPTTDSCPWALQAHSGELKMEQPLLATASHQFSTSWDLGGGEDLTWPYRFPQSRCKFRQVTCKSVCLTHL